MSPTRLLGRLRADDDGISLIEVMVAVTILAVTMAAVASTTIQSLTVARDSRDTVVATNVAQFELERLRSMPYDELLAAGGRGETTRSVTLDSGLTYDITREVSPVDAGADVDGCLSALGGGSGYDYLRVTQTITFGERDLAPVENVTIVAPRQDYANLEAGNLAVRLRDRDGEGMSGHTVQISGLAGVEAGMTDANGCIFFAGLDVNPDDPSQNGYTVTVDTDCHIDRATLATEIDDVQYVQAQQTTVAEYEYPECAAFELRPDLPATPLHDVGAAAGDAVGSRLPADACSLVDLGPVVECHDGGGNPVPVLPDGETWSATIPVDLAYSFDNATLGHTVAPDTAPDTDHAVDVRPTVVQPVYPFAAGYPAWAGRCVTSDPIDRGSAERHLLASEPGETTEAGIELATATVWTGSAQVDTADLDGDGDTTEPRYAAVAGQDVWAEARGETDCPDGDRMYLGRSDASGRLITLLPFGDWYLYHQAPLGGGGVADPLSGGPHSCVGDSPAAPTAECVEVRADYTVTSHASGATCAPGTDEELLVDTPTGWVHVSTSCDPGDATSRTYGYLATAEAP